MMPMYNVSVDGTCDTGRGANAYSCEGLWLLPTDDVIELTVYVDNTVAELCVLVLHQFPSYRFIKDTNTDYQSLPARLIKGTDNLAS